MTHLFAPLGRKLAIVSVAGAALVAGSFAPAMAQAPDNHPSKKPPAMAQTPDNNGKKPPAAAAATSSKTETVEQRIQSLKTALQIKPDQESKWNDVAQAMRDNASNMEKLVADKRKASPEKTTAIEDLKTYQDFAQAHLDNLKHLTSAFTSLYDSMTPEQKKNADTVFEKYGPARRASQG